MIETILFAGSAILFILVLCGYEIKHKKMRKELKEKIKGMQQEENRLHQKVLHADYHFKQIDQIEREMKLELAEIKRNRIFLNSAIRGKIQKTKRQSKRRKKSA